MTDPKSNSHHSHWLDAWHVNPSSNREYDFIDGLRGVAILMVLACHHFYINPDSGPAMHFIAAFIGAAGGGVNLFFALSGFLISWPFWKRKFERSEEAIPRGYARRRFWKIYPPLALSVLILTPLYIAKTHDWSYVGIAGRWLAGIAFLLPVSGKLNPVMWTLVVEVQFYILLPLFFLALKKASSMTALWLCTLVFLVIPTGYQLVTGFQPMFHPNIDSHFPSSLNCFYFGILIASLERQGLLKRSWAKFGFAGLLLWPVAMFLIAWARWQGEYETFAVKTTVEWLERIASGCLLLYVANPGHPVARALCHPALRWCGIVSYEWYLFHQPFSLWARIFFGPAGGNIAKYIGVVGGALLFSAVLAGLVYRYFSLPLLKYGRSSK